jgi:hypothetical protein
MGISAKSTSFIFSVELLLVTLCSSSVYAYLRNYISSPVIVDFLFNTYFYFSLLVFLVVALSISFSTREVENFFRSIYCTAICQAVCTVCIVFWLICFCSEVFHLNRIASTGPSGLALSALALAVSFVSTLLLYMIAYVSAPEGTRMVVFFSSPFCSCIAFLTMIFLLLGSGGWFHCSWTETGEHVLAIMIACVLSTLYGVVYFFATETEEDSSIRVRWMYLVATALDLLCLIVALAVSDATTTLAVVLVFLFTVALQLPRSFNIWNFIFTQVQYVPPAGPNKMGEEVVKANGSKELDEKTFTTRISKNVRFRQPSTIFGSDFDRKF